MALSDPKISLQVMENVFEQFDVDKDGKLQAQEMYKVMTAPLPCSLHCRRPSPIGNETP